MSASALCDDVREARGEEVNHEARLQRALDQVRRVRRVEPVDAVALREREVVLAPPDLDDKQRLERSSSRSVCTTLFDTIYGV